MITLREVSKVYEGRSDPAVDRVSLQVARGELVVLLGESGSGKTTTLKMINRLVKPTSGRIFLGGEDTSRLDPILLRRRIGYVFQNIGLFPHLTVAENIGMVPSLLGWSETRISETVNKLLNLLGLTASEISQNYPSQLSGGQQQRVGLARALAASPGILLMDEPFGAVDPVTRIRLQSEYRKLHSRIGLTTLMVTHDAVEGLLLADRLGVMRQGTLLQVGKPAELIQNPAHPYVEKLMESPRSQLDRLEALVEGESGA